MRGKRRTKPIEMWATRHFTRLLAGIVQVLPDAALPRFGDAVGRLLYVSLPQFRAVAMENLERAFGGELTDAQRKDLLRANFRHYGQTLVEFLVMRRWTREQLERRVALRGLEKVDEALARGQGLIIVTAHYGNWELLASRTARAGYSVNVIARDADDPATNEIINSIRGDCGYRVISRRGSARPALEILRRNELLAILLDQNTISGAVCVPFFGFPAATAPGPAALARRTGAPIIPVFSRRETTGRHVATFLPPIDYELTDDKERDIYEITARVTAAIEAQIRADPSQWLWIHRRWKKQILVGA